MGYQKITNLLDNKPTQSTKFRTKNWVPVNDDARGTYCTNNQIKFKASMSRSSLCDYNNAYILVKGTISIAQVLAPAQAEYVAKKVVFKNRISETNNTTDNAKYIDVIMPMYNLIEYSDNYAKTSGGLWK